ncbi:MAG: biopolymer transporter ExbD [Sporomusaceae bacterium]|nr:biopolymer transporter ExbD [Sporomusaceae bacterium]
MRLRSLRLQSQPKLMVIPLIDIIFFLLVFFMMSTMYMVEQRVLPIALPQAASGRHDLNKQVPITVTAQGRILVDQEEIPPELLGKRIQSELTRQPEALFLLRADRQTEYGKVVMVLDELKLAGVKRISVATESKPQ